MSKKNRAARAVNLLEVAERELSKGNIKQALKQAKRYYRSNPSDDACHVLQRAYLRRAEELYEKQLHKQAEAAILELAQLGGVATEHQAALLRLRTLLGLDPPPSASDRTADPRLLAELADRAVLSGELASDPAEIKLPARRIRAALDAVEAGANDAATAALSGISRSSPFSEWKLFARGLMALYDEDQQRLEDNWSRLAPDRPTHRIATSLEVITGRRRHDNVSDDVRRSLQTFWNAAEVGPLSTTLRNLSRQLAEGNWQALLSQYRKLVRRSAGLEPVVVQDITEVLCGTMLRQERHDELNRLLRYAPAPPLDPHFHRVKALIADSEHHFDHADQAWRAYIKDLTQTQTLSPADRETAIALVYQRLANMHSVAAQEAQRPSHPFSPIDEFDVELADQHAQLASEYYGCSLDRDPDLRGVYEEFAELLDDVLDEPSRAGKVYQRLVQRFPDDFDALLTTATHFTVRQDMPGLAEPYAERALRLRPRDQRAQSVAWGAVVGVARQAARKKQFAMARDQLVRAEELVGEAAGHFRYLLDAYRAAIEYKSDNLDRAEEYLQATTSHFDQPAAGLLLVSAQSARVGVSAQIRKKLNARFKQSVGRRATSQVAGLMSRFLRGLRTLNISYPGLKTHVSLVIKYLERSRRVCWEREDLVDACQFLQSEEAEMWLWEKLVTRGLTLFPHTPQFHFFSGQLEMIQGPFLCDTARACHEFEEAIRLSRTGESPLDEQMSDQASQAISLLERMPVQTPGRFGQPVIDDGFVDDVADEEDEDDDEVFAVDLLGALGRHFGIDLGGLMADDQSVETDTRRDASHTSRKRRSRKRKRKAHQ